MKCSHCNKEIPEISKFCPYCGIKINNDFDTEKEDQVNKKSINKEKEDFHLKKIYCCTDWRVGNFICIHRC